MSIKQKVEKITQLKAQLHKLNVEHRFNIRNTRAIASFYNNRLEHYSTQ